MNTSINKIGISLIYTYVFLNFGCATAFKSKSLGAGIGATTGAIAGGLANPGQDGEYRTRNVIIGSAFGGMLGTVVGNEIFKSNESSKHDEMQKTKDAKQNHLPGQTPTLTEPKIRSEWIENHITGNRYIEGHFEYIIEENSKWESSQ